MFPGPHCNFVPVNKINPNKGKGSQAGEKFSVA